MTQVSERERALCLCIALLMDGLDPQLTKNGVPKDLQAEIQNSKKRARRERNRDELKN
jgi:hypothetical protein